MSKAHFTATSPLFPFNLGPGGCYRGRFHAARQQDVCHQSAQGQQTREV